MTTSFDRGPFPVVEMVGVTKRFPGVLANDRVDFRLAAGEVHALLGENGAGKTTLMNILYGLYRPDEGEIRVRGRQVQIRSPKDAISLGIAMVHQHFELVDTLSVAENVALGRPSLREPLLDLDAVSKTVTELSNRYVLKVSPGKLVGRLSVGEKQRVEIIKALYRGAGVLILDEPTSVLTPQESEDLFALVRSMAGEGKSVIVITHKLPEVMAASDRVTVLRQGKVVGNVATKDTNPSELAYMMVGKELPQSSTASSYHPGQPILELQEVCVANDKGAIGLRGLSLTLSAGEILGIAGVSGNGQRELEEVISGTRHPKTGRLLVAGEDLTKASPQLLIDKGVGLVPEDRRGVGLVMELSIAENLILEMRSKAPFSRRNLLNKKEIQAYAERVAAEYSIATPDVGSPAYTLSGGNLQKLVLAKVLSRKPLVLVAAQPTAGLDVGAAQFIWQKLRDVRDRGVGILLISSDLHEVLSLSDRVACIFDGKIVGALPSGEADTRRLGLMMGGVVPG
ncbi:MAG TPA: ABC transporter ATP-binding protein [Nitrososphaerales archaeon]|nr:ABC transporter ATP-binding protein [Nitrososphaerales archaeon]